MSSLLSWLDLRSRHLLIILENRGHKTEDPLVGVCRWCTTELIPFLIGSEVVTNSPPVLLDVWESSNIQESIYRLWSDYGNATFEFPNKVDTGQDLQEGKQLGVLPA
jgi:hypothetical protein